MKKNGYLVFLCLGFCLLAGGIWGTVSLLEAFGEYLRATGVVERVHKERVYRPRRTRTVLRVDIYYDTERYGLLSLTPEFYLPFVMDEGDSIIPTVRATFAFRCPRDCSTVCSCCLGQYAYGLAGS